MTSRSHANQSQLSPWLALLYAFGTPVFFRTGFINHNMILGHFTFVAFLAMWNPGKDTRWHDVAVLKPQTTTKEEVQARAHRKRFLGVIPHGQKVKKTDIDTSALGAPKEPPAAKEPAKEPPATAPIKQQ